MISWMLSGCLHFAPYEPSSVRITGRSVDKIYAATVRVFLKKGWGFQARDPVAHAVETDWVQWNPPSGSMACVAYRILINRDSIEIFSSCKYGCGPGNSACPEGQRPVGTKEHEHELVQATLDESGRI